jgi:Uma2 family endonuclease
MADRSPFFHAQQALIDRHAAKHRAHKELRGVGDGAATRHALRNRDDDPMSSVSLARHPVSFSELLQYPEDGRRYELYDGELLELSAPIILHQLAMVRAAEVLRAYERTHGGLVVVAPMDVVFDEFNVLEPDVLFVVAARVHLLDVRQHVHIPPDVVVEVLSPSTARRDRGVKMRMYAACGVREYWIIDAEERQVQIHSLTDSGWVLAQNGVPGVEIASAILEGLRFDPTRLFEE